MKKLALLILAGACSGSDGQHRTGITSDTSGIITRLHPDRARYLPGDTVTFTAELRNDGEETVSGPLRLRIHQLAELVYETEVDVELDSQESRTVKLRWTAPATDFVGYLVVGELRGTRSTAVDVSSVATAYPRYGYLSDFAPTTTSEARAADIRRLAQDYHIDMFQFYDWFWRHDILLRRTTDGDIADVWFDLFGRRNSWPLIQDMIATVREQNALAMAYVMIYAAREEYEVLTPVEPSWGIFAEDDATAQLNVDFGRGTFLFLFDPANTGWQDYMVGQYADALRNAPFDGVHIDQLGPRFGVHDFDGNEIQLQERFPPFLEQTKQRLQAEFPDRSTCVYNIVDGSVNGWATTEVATGYDCDVLYSELWFTTNTYEDIRRYVEYLRDLGGRKPLVLAGYAQYNEATGPLREAEEAPLQDGVTVSSQHGDFTGSGYVDGFDEVGDALGWTVDVGEEEGNVTFIFRYANATGQTATRNVYVDEQLIGTVQMYPREQWSTWAIDAFVQTRLAAGSHDVRLAYDDDSSGVVHVDHLQTGEFDEDSIRLENAAMFASGATHIQLGDDVQSLAHEYFPNRSKSLTVSEQRALRRQYSFITAYEQLLFPGVVVPMNPAGTGSLGVLGDQPLADAGAGAIWPVIRTGPGFDVIHLINLIGVDDDLWRNAAPTPEFQEDVRLRYYGVDPDRVERVWWATPDRGDLSPQLLETTSGSDPRGRFVEFAVPQLAYWDMVVVERTP